MPKSHAKSTPSALIRKAVHGDRRAISQLMSMAENDPQARITILSKLYWLTGKAQIVGITGPPGCGKSTLIAQLAKRYRDAGRSVGIVAVDPSSHITGGALLGDRIRMGELASDPRVFIRSMATRGHFGGVARATEDAVRILDASAMDYVIVETAGAGQSDVYVKQLAHTTVVVTAPGMGDEIQALKAGIMEIADIFVVNKADREDADRAAQEIHQMIMMSEPFRGWRPRVLKTVATSGDGVAGLVETINQHAKYLGDSGGLRKTRVARLPSEVLEVAKQYFEEVTLKEIATSEMFQKIMRQVTANKIDPYSAGRKLVSKRLARR
ncbi:MAG: methylmalonyl Co-A mutase-associated GTPase MeaB [Candidatus Bathyarchaeia archaeon]